MGVASSRCLIAVAVLVLSGCGGSGAPTSAASASASAEGAAQFCSDMVAFKDQLQEDIDANPKDALALLEAAQKTSGEAADLLERDAGSLNGAESFDAQDVVDAIRGVSTWSPVGGSGTFQSRVDAVSTSIRTFSKYC